MTFTQNQMNRCSEIARQIHGNGMRHVMRATGSLQGKTLADLYGETFEVGIEPESLSRVSFQELLVIVSTADKLYYAKQENGKATFEVKTEFSEREAAELVALVEIELPHDGGKTLKLSRVKPPEAQAAPWN